MAGVLVTGALLCAGSMGATTFRPSTAQLVVSVCVALAAVAAAFGMPRAGAGAAPAGVAGLAAGLVGLVVAFVCLSVFQLGHEAGPPWFACTVMLVALAVLGALVLRWRFPAGGLGAGAVLVYVVGRAGQRGRTRSRRGRGAGRPGRARPRRRWRRSPCTGTGSTWRVVSERTTTPIG